MESYAHYDITENDPYLLQDSECLINLVDCTNTTELNEIERKVTQLTLAELVAKPVRPTFDFLHLCEIHRRLFSRIYPFAGQIRKVEISKSGRLFLPYALIESEANKCFAQLKQENYLKGLSPSDFANRAGFFLGWINKIHAFREGNGRTQRILVDQLAAQNNYYFEWSAISNKAMADASREARTVDTDASALSKLLSLNIVLGEC